MASLPASRYQPLIMVLAAVAAGILVDRYHPLHVAVWLGLALLATLAWLTLWLRRWESAACAMLLLGVAALGGTWHHDRWYLYYADEIGRYGRVEPYPVCLRAVAVEGARWSPAPSGDAWEIAGAQDRTEVLLHVQALRAGHRWQAASGYVPLRIRGRLEDLRAGDQLLVLGLLQAAPQPRNPGETSYADYLRCERQLCQLNASSPVCVQRHAAASSITFRHLLDHTRRRGQSALWQHIDQRRAGLAAAILLGNRSQLDSDRTEPYWTTGSVHLLSISGLHVGILAYGFWLAVRCGVLPRRYGVLVIAVLAILYAALTDARPPVIRATVLILVMCLARWLGRRALAFNTLAAAGLVVLALSPGQLFQTGTQLSFLAVATLALSARRGPASAAHDPLEQLVRRAQPLWKRLLRWLAGVLWEVVSTSAAVWLASVPLVLYRFHLFSLVAVPLNPLLWLPIAIALFSGFGVLLLAAVCPPAAGCCGWICDINLSLIEWLVEQASRFPAGHFWAAGPPLWWLIVLYGSVAVTVAWRPRATPKCWGWALLTVWSAIGLWSCPDAPPVLRDREPLVCHFISVGHGTSVLLKTPDGRSLLYDAGRLGPSSGGVRAISAVLWHEGITHLDAVILSHADADHYNALSGLLRRFSVGVVYVSPQLFESESAGLALLHEALLSSGVPVEHVFAGDRLQADEEVLLEILHPPETGVGGSDNANSIVLSVTYHDHRLLLPGDLEPPGLEELLAEPLPHWDVVMAPHHGSLHSSPADFVAWARPQWVVVSGGMKDQVTMNKIEAAYQTPVLHTARSGAVRIEIDRSGVRVRPWMRSK